MKINKPSLSKKSIVVTISVIVVLVASYGAYAMTSSSWPFTPKESPKTSTSTDTTTANSDTATNSPDANPPSNTPTDSPKTPANNDNPAPAPENKLGVTLTSITMANNNVKVKSLIEAITNKGTCTLTLTKGSIIVTKTSGIQALPHSSTCKGFDIPTSELSSGIWHIKLSVVSGSKAGSAGQDYEVM